MQILPGFMETPGPKFRLKRCNLFSWTDFSIKNVTAFVSLHFLDRA